MCGKTRKDKVRNEDIRRQVGIAPSNDKLRENCLWWFVHIGRRSRDAFDGLTWMGVIKNDIKLLELEERMVIDRNNWRRRIHVLDQI